MTREEVKGKRTAMVEVAMVLGGGGGGEQYY